MNSDVLKSRRKSLALSQDAVASRVGVKRQVLSRWESGQRVVSRKHRGLLAEVLQMREAELDELIAADTSRTQEVAARAKAGRPVRLPYPTAGTVQRMLRTGGLAESLHQKARLRLSAGDYKALADGFPRDTHYELLLVFLLIALGARPIWTCPARLRCPLLVLDDFLPDFGGGQMQWALLWEGDGERIVVFGQIRLKAPYVKSRARVDFLVYYKRDKKRGQWLTVELDGKHHPSQQDQDEERAEGLLVPEVRYDNRKLCTPDFSMTLMRDIRAAAVEGARRERERIAAARLRRKERAERVAKQLAA